MAQRSNFFDRMKSGLMSSVSTRAIMSVATTVNPVAGLLATHQGRVLLDGAAVGTIGLVGSVAGLPRDIWEFGRERVTGQRREASNQTMSSEWIENKLEGGYRSGLHAVTGSRGPTIREGTSDELLHLGGQAVPLIASFFVPGAGQARVATMGAKVLGNGRVATLAGQFAGRAGTQLLAVDVAMLGTQGVEGLLGINRPYENAVRERAAGQASSNNPGALSPVTAASFNNASMHVNREPQYFNSQLVFQIQRELGFQGDDLDGLMGKKTIDAMDNSIKTQIDPSNLTPEQRSFFQSRMTQIAQELERHPPSPYNYDPRVMELQVNAYALGLYDKKIDGLVGEGTFSAIERLQSLDMPTLQAAVQPAPQLVPVG